MQMLLAPDAAVFAKTLSVPACPGSEPEFSEEVEKVGVSLDRLQMLKAEVQKIQKLSKALIAEAERREIHTYNQNYIIHGVSVNVPVNCTKGAYLPLRKKWVAYYVSELADSIHNLSPQNKPEQEASSVSSQNSEQRLNTIESQDLVPSYERWMTALDRLNTELDELDWRIQDQKYERFELSYLADAIQTESKEMDLTLKEAMKIAKQTKREKNQRLVSRSRTM